MQTFKVPPRYSIAVAISAYHTPRAEDPDDRRSTFVGPHGVSIELHPVIFRSDDLDALKATLHNLVLSMQARDTEDGFLSVERASFEECLEDGVEIYFSGAHADEGVTQLRAPGTECVLHFVRTGVGMKQPALELVS